MNNAQRTRLNNFGRKNSQLGGVANNVADIELKTSYLYPTSIFAITSEIIVSEDGGVFREFTIYEVCENGTVSNTDFKKLEIPERNKFYLSLKDYKDE